MLIRKAVPGDLEAALEVYDTARSFMRAHGNSSQWINGYPRRELVADDISSGKLFICEENKKTAAVFYYAKEDEPTYRVIDGSWISDKPYAVLHRIGSSGIVKGAGTFSIIWALNDSGHLRIDTHQDNYPMQSLLLKLGFTRCGIITIEDGTPRIAFEKLI